jgi:hypothetical protein
MSLAMAKPLRFVSRPLCFVAGLVTWVALILIRPSDFPYTIVVVVLLAVGVVGYWQYVQYSGRALLSNLGAFGIGSAISLFIILSLMIVLDDSGSMGSELRRQLPLACLCALAGAFVGALPWLILRLRPISSFGSWLVISAVSLAVTAGMFAVLRLAFSEIARESYQPFPLMAQVLTVVFAIAYANTSAALVLSLKVVEQSSITEF